MNRLYFIVAFSLLIISSLIGGSSVSLCQDNGIQTPPLSLTSTQEEQTPALNLSDFSGGLNKKSFPTQLKDNEAQKLENAWWDKYGALGRRKGWTHFPIPDSGIGINGLYRYYQYDGDRYLLVGGDTALYRAKDDSTTLVKIKSDIPPDNQIYFITYKDNIYGSIYNTYPFVYDGITFESLGVRFDSAQIKTIWVSSSYDCYPVIAFTPTKDWDIDQYAGYVACAYDTVEAEWICDFILNNDDTSISLAGDAWNYVGGNLYLYSVFYDRQPIFIGVADSVNRSFCATYFWDSTFTPAHWFQNKFYWVEVNSYEGITENHFFIRDNPYTTYFQVLDSVPTLIDYTYKVYQKTNYPAKYISTFRNRVFLAFDSTSGNMVYYSTVENPGDFPPFNFFTTYTPDGDVITGLMPLYNDQKGVRASSEDKLMIFKQNNILACGDNFIPYIIATGLGTIAPRSIINIEGRYIVFANNTGFYSTDGNVVSEIALSEQIKPFWDNINKTAIDKIACGYYDRHIVCSVPYGSSTENDTGLIYNIDNKSWSTANIKASVFANQWSLQDTIKFIWGRPDTGWVCQYGTSDLDNGTDSITLSYRSKEFDFGNLNLTKKFQEMYVAYDKTLPLTFNFYKDFGDSVIYTTSLTGTGKNIVRVPLSSDIQGKTLSFGLESKDPTITIGGIQIKVKFIGGL